MSFFQQRKSFSELSVVCSLLKACYQINGLSVQCGGEKQCKTAAGNSISSQAGLKHFEQNKFMTLQGDTMQSSLKFSLTVIPHHY